MTVAASDHAPRISFSRLGARACPPTIAHLMAAALERPGLLSLAAGFTDNRTLPVAPVADAIHALAKRFPEPEYLQYGSNRGRPKLRRLLAERVAGLEPGLTTAEVDAGLFVTNGSQQALYLAMQVLCEPGDIVLVDRPSYFVFLEMLAGLGIEARSIPVDETGALDLAALDALLGQLVASGDARRLKAAYVVSYFSNPSSRSLTAAEKTGVAERLTRHGLIVPVIEDAAYRELYFDQPWPSASVLTLPAFAAFPRFYVSTLTKSFATGLKVGYGVCTDPEWMNRMLHVKGHHDFGTANFNQAVLETVLENGAFDACLRELRPAYQAKGQVLDQALRTEGLAAQGWSWAEPAGGLYLWLRGPAGLKTGMTSAFCRACLDAGVLYVPGELCFGDAAPENYVRLSFGVLGERDLVEAARRFAAVAKRLS